MVSRITVDSQFERFLRNATCSDTLFPPGEALQNGRFIIIRQLGRGGMGIVYEAHDTQYDIRVAVKALPRASEEGVERLKQEFRSLANVVHPNLVGLNELFVSEKQSFFSMELVHGGPLLEQLARSPSLSRVRKAFAQLAAGIRAIHVAGKLHRDIKPSNVMLTPSDRVVLLDFGLVRNQRRTSSMEVAFATSGTAFPSGTPGYMAPEQNAAGEFTEATDWYAFGVMLRKALTNLRLAPGHRSLRGKSRARPSRRATQPTLAIPSALETLCDALLSCKPAERPDYDHICRTLGSRAPASLPVNREQPSLFVGRAREFACLTAAYRRATRGSVEIIDIQGGSGLGKSALADRFLSSLDPTDDTIVLAGRCFERESIPFKTCEPLIEQLVRHLIRLPHDRLAMIVPPHISALTRMFPALGRLPSVRATAPAHATPHDPRRQGFASANSLFANITRRFTLVIFVDDLQWGDADGAALLRSILWTISGHLLFIGAQRLDERNAGSPSRDLFHGLDRTVTHVTLSPLSASEADRLATALLSPDRRHLARCVSGESRGNPFLLRELCRTAETSPFDAPLPNIGQMVADRVRQLPLPAADILNAVCVADHPVDPRTLSSTTNGAEIYNALRALSATRLLKRTVGEPDRVTCYHDRIRTSVLQSLNADVQKQYHARLALGGMAGAAPDPTALLLRVINDGKPLDRIGPLTSTVDSRMKREPVIPLDIDATRSAQGIGR